jgi:hypothetical protein
MTNEEKNSIIRTLETQSTIRGVSTELAIQAGQNTKAAVVPPEYARFHKLFSDAESSQFPPSRPWDHAIDFKPNAPDALPCKVYPMTQGEDQALLKFLKEQGPKDTHALLFHHTLHLSSSFRKRMANYVLCKTTDVLMTSLSAINTLSRSSQICSLI